MISLPACLALLAMIPVDALISGHGELSPGQDPGMDEWLSRLRGGGWRVLAQSLDDARLATLGARILIRRPTDHPRRNPCAG